MENIITLPVSELKTALTGLGKVVSKSTLPVLKTVRVMRNQVGSVSLQGTDLDSYVTYSSSTLQPGPVCEFLAPMECLAKAVKGSSSKDSIALVQDKEVVKLRTFIGSNPVDQTLETIDPKEWPPVPEIKGTSMKVNGEFTNTLRQAFECASEDYSRAILQGACLDATDPKAHYIAASNGRVMFSGNSFHFALQQSVVIPNCKFLNWSALGEGEAELMVQPPQKPAGKKNEEKQTPGWIQYQTAHWKFITKSIDGEFPNWRQVVPANTTTFVLLKEDAIKTMLEVLSKIPGDDTPTHTVVLAIKNGYFMLEGCNKNSSTPTKVPIDNTEVGGPDVRVALNRHNMALALKFGMNEIHLIDELSPVVFNNTTKKLVIAPVRLEGSPAPTQAVPQANEETNPPAAPTPAEPTPNQPHANEEAQPKEEPMAKKTEATTTETEAKPENPIRTIIEHIDQIKANLGEVVRDLAQATSLLKQVEREKKATDKEIEAIRSKLREIQSVRI